MTGVQTCALPIYYYAYYLTALGDMTKAIAERETARKLDPVSPLLTTAPAVGLPAGTRRRDITLNQCPSAAPAARQISGTPTAPSPPHASTSAACPHRDEPVAISELTDRHPTRRHTADQHESGRLGAGNNQGSIHTKRT